MRNDNVFVHVCAMGLIIGLVIMSSAAFGPSANAETATRKAVGEIEPLPQDLEIQLALSALPKELLELPTLTTFGLVAVFLAVHEQAKTAEPELVGGVPVLVRRIDLAPRELVALAQQVAEKGGVAMLGSWLRAGYRCQSRSPFLRASRYTR